MAGNNTTNMKSVQKNTIEVRADYQVTRTPIKSESGLVVQKKARVIFDYSGKDTAGANNSAIGTHGTGVYLPSKAVVTRAWYEVVSAFTSAASTATVALQAEGANDIKTATAVSDATLGTTGFKEGVPDGTAAKFVQATQEREIKVVTAVQTLTAGRLVLLLEYAIGE